jgi:hypothetical protein
MKSQKKRRSSSHKSNPDDGVSIHVGAQVGLLPVGTAWSVDRTEQARSCAAGPHTEDSDQASLSVLKTDKKDPPEQIL